MTDKATIEAFAELDALTKERDALLASVAPLEAEKELACAERIKWNDRAEALANEINAKLSPRMGELMGRIRILSVGLSGKKREG